MLVGLCLWMEIEAYVAEWLWMVIKAWCEWMEIKAYVAEWLWCQPANRENPVGKFFAPIKYF